MNIYLFNPETDLALGHNRRFYTPTKHVAAFRKCCQLLPSILASPGDVIALPDSSAQIENLPFFPIIKEKELKPIPLENLRAEIDSHKREDSIIFRPWGWNLNLLHILQDAGIPTALLPDYGWIDNLRSLSNRKTTTMFFKENGEYFKGISTPEYLSSIQELEQFIEKEHRFVLKAPWSSSGRGIVISTEMAHKQILEWASGIIRSQGAVMGEKLYEGVIDFASEWLIENSLPIYKGLSLFQTSGRGKYKGNILKSQTEIEALIKKESDWNPDILEIQKEFIGRHIAPSYSGPLGFDMLIDKNGIVNPCVEINIRHTMGHVAIEVEKEINSSLDSKLSGYLRELFPENIFNLANLKI